MQVEDGVRDQPFGRMCRNFQRQRALIFLRQTNLPAGGFSRGLRLDRERMDGALEFRRKRRIYHTVAFNPALPFEGRRYDIDPEMRLAARPVARMALMQMRFVRNVEAFRQESFTQLVYDSVPGGAHDGGR
ncbi:hypothetical protein V1279_006827 [Bradyrhizobium sp. AZCC 1610]